MDVRQGPVETAVLAGPAGGDMTRKFIAWTALAIGIGFFVYFAMLGMAQ